MRDIIYFDVETTGVNIKNDRIIELYAVKESIGKTDDIMHFYFNTDVEISPEAYNKHGLNNDSLKDKPYFNQHAEEIYNFFKDCDLAGFNIINFDIAILYEELSRCGLHINFFSVNIFDVFKILTKKEPRTLEAYYERTFGRKFENAHSASSDVEASRELFKHQLQVYYNNEFDAKIINNDVRVDSNGYRLLDYSGFFKSKDNKIYYNKGKYKNNEITIDLDYLNYIANDASCTYFDSNIRQMARIILKKLN